MNKIVKMLTISSLSALMAIAGFAVAEEKKEPKYKDVETRTRASVGKTCAKALEKVQEVIEAEQWAQAKNELLGVESSSKTCATDYEQTQVWKFLGYTFYSLDDMNSAIKYYNKVVNGVGTPPELALDTRYTLAQLYTVQEDYPNAAKQLEAWMAAAIIVGGDAKVLLAQIYYQMERKKDSLRLVEEAIADSESKGNLPKEGWWGLQRVIYYENGNYKKTVEILEKLVTHYPKWSYWRQLGGMYGELERDMDRLVATDVVYLNGQLDKESQVISLGYMYLGAEAPYNGAKIIAKGMKDGIIEKSAKNLEVLGTAWYQAKDLRKAVDALEEAAKKSDNGNIQSRLAAIYLDQGRDNDAYKAAVRAEKRGGMKRPDSNYLVMGNALINMHCYGDATKVFKEAIKAAKDEKSKSYPRQWIRYADSESERLASLKNAGAKVPSCAKG